jgi:hypothetical protein
VDARGSILQLFTAFTVCGTDGYSLIGVACHAVLICLEGFEPSMTRCKLVGNFREFKDNKGRKARN